jgi:hypothetical protein
MTDDEVVAYLTGDLDSLPASADTGRVERTRALLGEPSLWVEPSQDLEQRVIDAVNAAVPSTSSATSSASTPSTAPAGAAPVSEVAGIAGGRRLPRRWVRTTVFAAAAAVLLAVGLATVITTQRDRPVEFAAALQGTELAPAATGSVTMTQTTSGWRIHITATGLPRLDGGRYYQGWLKDAAGNLVPIGTFNEGKDVTLWAGVPPSDYPTITITRQAAGAGPASSGQKVLVGTTHRTH